MLRAKDLVYPVILFVFATIVFILFFMATGFIGKNVNTAFSDDYKNESKSLNMANYTIITKKLGLNTETKNEVVEAPSEVSSATTSTVLERKILTLTVLNSTTIDGSAKALATRLESAGFAKAKIGGEKTLYATTTIFIKESRAEFTSLLLEEVQKIYPSAYATTTASSAEFDATIIIGTK